jgi:hypothetical protein
MINNNDHPAQGRPEEEARQRMEALLYRELPAMRGGRHRELPGDPATRRLVKAVGEVRAAVCGLREAHGAACECAFCRDAPGMVYTLGLLALDLEEKASVDGSPGAVGG